MEKKTKGITLIALVITIIVLLILAGVSIATLTGENGILTRAVSARKKWEESSGKERIEIEMLGSYGTDGKLDLEKLKENLRKNIPEANITGEEFPIIVTLEGYSYEIDEQGNIEMLRKQPNISNLNVTQSTGEEIPEEGVENGTKLKVEFEASIEGGTIKEV